MNDRMQRLWFEFVRKSTEIPAEFSLTDLRRLRSVAQNNYPALVKLVDAYLHLAKQTGDVDSSRSSLVGPTRLSGGEAESTPLFELLRDRRLFPTNSHIASFAQRVVPNMRQYRFDKMSKGEIALRVIEYLETLKPGTRSRLENSMRAALAVAPETDVDRKSFMAKWEGIIKDMTLSP